jgi:hypothetical protein
VPDFIKTEITNYMLDYVSIPTRILLADPDYFYLEVTTTVQYDSAVTTKSKNEIRGLIENEIQTFSDDNLNLFDSDFRFSRFVRTIDDADDSIISNDTSIMLTKRLLPQPNEYFTTTIDFNNAIHNHHDGATDDASVLEQGVVYSSYFTYIAPDGTQYPLSYIKENGIGDLIIVSLINNTLLILNNNIGTVDYDTGITTINKLLCTNYGDFLRIYVHTTAKDVLMSKDKIVLIDSDDVSVTVIGRLD